jgi:hypothetical protein
MKTMIIALRRRMALACALLLAACSDQPIGLAGPHSDATPGVARTLGAVAHFDEWIADRLALEPSPVQSTAPVLVGAGDIAECYDVPVPPSTELPSLETARQQALVSPAAATAALLDRIPGTVVALGDNAYQVGSPFDYDACYDPTWGRHYERTRPAAGNHEYMTPGAAGYFGYFPDRSAPPRGYYSYDLGSWHVVVLNSTPQVYGCYPPETKEVIEDPLWPEPMKIEPTTPALGRLCAGDLVQQAWLIKDLARHATSRCTVAYFHHPRFSSGSHGNHYQMQRIWDIMYAYGVDVVLSAHDHNYERFAPQDPEGRRDEAFGIREFVIGTGGGTLRSVDRRVPNSEVVITGQYGVMALGLDSGGYGWSFVATDQSVLDSGSDRCHGAPPRRAFLPVI